MIDRRANWLLVAILVACVSAQSCVRVPKRNPLPRQLAAMAVIPGIPNARFWGDERPSYLDAWLNTPKEQLKQEIPKVFGKPQIYLALSGGGADGAFGAGLLNGWTKAGNRPEFTVVTGISTGALSAPFAFLGPDYDDELEEVYTTSSTKDILKMRNLLAGFRGDAFASTKPLRRLLVKYIDEDVRQAIAQEHRQGRRLFVGTTNLDADRPVIWNLGAIAASSYPGALELIHRVMLASASIPVAFPPVLVGVEADGRGFDEIHVDGGVSKQLFLYPAGPDWRLIQEKLATPGKPRVYLIRNSRVDPQWETVKNKLGPIAGRSVSSLIRAQGVGDIYRIYLQALRDGLDFNLAYIPADFEDLPTEPFDVAYMGKLYEVGYRLAATNQPWTKTPPGFKYP